MRDAEEYPKQLLDIPGGQYVRSLESSSVLDSILEYHTSKGPFLSEEAFNNALADAYYASYKGDVLPFIVDMLEACKCSIVVTQANFRPANIMVEDGRISGIIDWEMAGWYHEHWEFVKAFCIWHWKSDRGTRLLGAIKPHYREQRMHQRLSRSLI